MSPMHMRWGRLYRGTPAELALEDAVAELGVPYRAQFPGFLYGVRSFPDFFLPTLKLVIEVDDPSHNRAEKKIEDEERTRTLSKEWGVRVVRCTNKNALDDPRGTVRAMLSSVGLWPIPSRNRPIAGCLPVPKKAPKKGRREAVASERRATRRKSASRTSPRAARQKAIPESLPAPVPTPRPSGFAPACDPAVDYCAAADPDNFLRNCTCEN